MDPQHKNQADDGDYSETVDAFEGGNTLSKNLHSVIVHETNSKTAANVDQSFETDDVDVEAMDSKDDCDLNQTTHNDCPSPVEATIEEVIDRFRNGCQCMDRCFDGLSAETVHKHRLNIAELTKEEHDMYLMGVIMASLLNPTQTSRNKERKRQWASYVYQGKRVCLDAFLFLENVTHYHLKIIRNHLLKHGVTSRTHGNLRKKPHNSFPLDIYKNAENFVKQHLREYSSDLSKTVQIYGTNRSHMYRLFKEKCEREKRQVMSSTTFRIFLNRQFPKVKFMEKKARIDTEHS